MALEVDPKQYGISSRTKLSKETEDHFIIFIDRKSRIIMKDAMTLVEKAKKIQQKRKAATITIKTTAPVCSKSILLFQENGIDLKMI